MSALSAIEAGTDTGAVPRAGAAGSSKPGLQLVAGEQSVTGTVRRARAPSASRGTGLGARPAARRPGTPRPPAAPPLRLTRRGRIVVAVFAVALVTVMITLVGMAVAGGAQAANHGRPGAGYQGMRQIVVRPGETLWSIASQAEPSVDPRLVISQIVTANSLSSTAVQAGELLWVPK